MKIEREKMEEDKHQSSVPVDQIILKEFKPLVTFEKDLKARFCKN